MTERDHLVRIIGSDVRRMVILLLRDELFDTVSHLLLLSTLWLLLVLVVESGIGGALAEYH